MNFEYDITNAKSIYFTYTNWSGKISTREARPISVRFGASEYHEEPQWLMLAFDDDLQEIREFAMRDMRAVGEVKP